MALAGIDALPAQADDLSGISVVRPGGYAYDTRRMDFNARINKFPGLIAYCKNAHDVSRVVAYAHARELQTSVRSGAHDFEGYSLNNRGAVIDISRMSGIEHTGDGLLKVLPGTPMETLYAWSAAGGFALPGGTCPSVGSAGLCAGGGFGFLSPWYGLYCDRLRRVQMVDARGNLRDSLHDPDLLWASQGGGGGNFGVIVASYFEPVPVPKDFVTFKVRWPWDRSTLRASLQMFFRWTTGVRVPYYLSFQATSKSSGSFEMLGLGRGDIASVRADVRRHLGKTGGTLSLQRASFTEVVDFFGGEGVHKRTKVKSHLGRDVPPPQAIDAIVDHLANTPGPNDAIELDTFGEAIGRVASDATAFPHRDMKYILLYQAHWTDPADDAVHEGWIRSLYSAVDPHLPRASYRNFSDSGLADWAYRYYGHNYQRLQHVKARLDPANRFHYAQSIKL